MRHLLLIILTFFSFNSFGQSSFTSEELKSWNSLKDDFKEATYPFSFCEINSDFKPLADTIFRDRGEFSYMSLSIKDSLLHKEIGSVVGPFRNKLDNSSQTIDFVFMIRGIDSLYFVRASHILIREKPFKDDSDFYKEDILADKIILKIKSGASFEKMASKYGTDGTAKSGGDLGWFGEGVMVKSFNDACMQAKKNDLFKVQTQFGIHVVKITEDKIKVPVHYIVLPIIKYFSTN